MSIQRLELNGNAYPPLLAEMKGCPDGLWFVGDPGALALPCVSVIGSRAISAYGDRVTRLLVPQLVRAGLAIVSGLAYGVDGLAHRVALESGGTCVAVLGGGLDRIYPAAHERLAQRVAGSGCLLSEYQPGTPSLKRHFPERNRIVAGLSPFTLIIEAGMRSGTLSTARHALDAGREVGVVPGDITADSSLGVHQLLRDGARPVTCVQDVLDVYGIEAEPEFKPGRPSLTGMAADLYALISARPFGVDDLQAALSCPPDLLQGCLSQLELDGYIRFSSYTWQKT